MRNIFVEGVRSAFIRIIRLITYIIIGLIIFYIIGLFTSKKAHALSIKEQQQITLGGWQQNQMNGYVLLGSSQGVPSLGQTDVRFNLNTPISTSTDYDYIGFKLWMELYNEFEYSHNYCTTYSYTYDSQGRITQMTCSSSGTNINLHGTIEVMPLIIDTSDNLYHCFFSHDFDNVVVCPSGKTYKQLVLHINSTYPKIEYRLQVTNFGIYYNDISTDIVNGINGITTAQQQTITVIQQQTQQQEQQNQYMQSDNVTTSTTNMTTSITTMTDDITQRLSGASELTQIVLAPLALLTGLATDTCAPLVLQVPFVNYTANLPCMKPVFNQYFNGLYSIFTTIISAIMTYWISVKTFSLIKDILDCDNDRIEVIDL